MGDSQDSAGEGLEPPFDATNPFPFLTDEWGVHDSVLGIITLFGEPWQTYTDEEAKSFRYHFEFIGAVLDKDIAEVLDVFNDAAIAKVQHPRQITDMLCGSED